MPYDSGRAIASAAKVPFIAMTLALALVSGGCLVSTEPSLSVTFSIDAFDPADGELPSDTAEAGAGFITVTGGIETPCLAVAGQFRAEGRRDGANLLVEIRWQPGVQPCEPGVSSFVYGVVLSRLRPGTYHLEVTHEFPDQSGYVALDQTISLI